MKSKHLWKNSNITENNLSMLNYKNKPKEIISNIILYKTVNMKKTIPNFDFNLKVTIKTFWNFLSGNWIFHAKTVGIQSAQKNPWWKFDPSEIRILDVLCSLKQTVTCVQQNMLNNYTSWLVKTKCFEKNKLFIFLILTKKNIP